MSPFDDAVSLLEVMTAEYCLRLSHETEDEVEAP